MTTQVPLSPDAAVEAFRAHHEIGEWTSRRFIAHFRDRFPNRRRLLGILQAAAPGSETPPQLVGNAVRSIATKALRLMVEEGRLPPLGPFLTLDGPFLYRFAGLLVAPFLADLAGSGILEDDAVERAKAWRPSDLKAEPGVFGAALRQVFKEIGAPDLMGSMVAPLISSLVAGHVCLRWPSAEVSVETELRKMASAMAGLKADRSLDADGIFQDDAAMSDLIRASASRDDFMTAVDTKLFSGSEALMDEVDKGVDASMQILRDEDPQDGTPAQADAIMRQTRYDMRAINIAHIDFLRAEADRIWGPPAEVAAAPTTTA